MIDGISIPLPSAEAAAAVVLAFLAGATCPTYYAQERLRGFGRTLFDRLPYRPPPGMDREEALQVAVESAEEHDQHNADPEDSQ